MSEEENDILVVVMVDKREVDLKSPNMEPAGLCKALTFLIDKEGFKVAELVTDAHPQIPPILLKFGFMTVFK